MAHAQSSRWIVAFDIGKCNFAFCIEESEIDSKKYRLPKTRCQIDGKPTPEYQEVLDSAYTNGKVILFENLDLTEGTVAKKSLEMKVQLNMIDALDKYREYFDKCDTILIEQQMTKNTMAYKLGQHCYSYFLMTYRDTKEILEFPARHKTQILGAPRVRTESKKGKVSYKLMTKTQRKKWAIEQALAILHQRDDHTHSAQLGASKKKDDMADCLLMINAHKILKMIN